jgi:hypothetical protein
MSSSHPKPEQRTSSLENDRLDLEKEKLAFDVRKFDADESKRKLEAEKLSEELRDLRRPWYKKPSIFLGPLSTVIVAIIAGIIAFGTDVLKMNVAALINKKMELSAENRKLSEEIAGKVLQLQKAIDDSQKRLQESERISTLAISGLNGDAKAWDAVQSIHLASRDAGIKQRCQGVLDEIYNSRLPSIPGMMTWGVDPWVLPLPKGTDGIAALKSTDWKTRIAGVQILKAAKARSAVPQLIQLVEKDPLVDVRKAAQLTVEELAGKTFSHLDYRSMGLWWKASAPKQ